MVYYVSPCIFCLSSPKYTCISNCSFSICCGGKNTFILFTLFLCISLKYSLSLLDTNLIHLHAALLILLCGPSFNLLSPAQVHCTSIAICEISVMNFTFLIYICFMFVCAVICPFQLWRTLLTVTAILVFHIFQSCITVVSSNTASKQQEWKP